MTIPAFLFSFLHVYQDRLDKELKELDYELKVQSLVETASSHKSGDGLELHFAACSNGTVGGCQVSC